jgi:hypothetical protein
VAFDQSGKQQGTGSILRRDAVGASKPRTNGRDRAILDEDIGNGAAKWADVTDQEIGHRVLDTRLRLSHVRPSGKAF